MMGEGAGELDALAFENAVQSIGADTHYEADHDGVSDVTDGATIPNSADLGVPVVAFSPQGAPVAVDTPAEWGTGAGGIYVTDNDNMVLAILIAPLGSVKVQKLDPSDGKWK